MARLMKSLPGRLRPYVIFAYNTGARHSELLALIWNDVNFKCGFLTRPDKLSSS